MRCPPPRALSSTAISHHRRVHTKASARALPIATVPPTTPPFAPLPTGTNKRPWRLRKAARMGKNPTPQRKRTWSTAGHPCISRSSSPESFSTLSSPLNVSMFSTFFPCSPLFLPRPPSPPSLNSPRTPPFTSGSAAALPPRSSRILSPPLSFAAVLSKPSRTPTIVPVPKIDVAPSTVSQIHRSNHGDEYRRSDSVRPRTSPRTLGLPSAPRAPCFSAKMP